MKRMRVVMLVIAIAFAVGFYVAQFGADGVAHLDAAAETLCDKMPSSHPKPVLLTSRLRERIP